ncbi:phosphatase PAP2 family protein [Budvicia aquatica]|uniref:PAP2 superfamily n=1 Tax=Budvicia aquatica TaxID=82979 RepID=A0A484ZFJ6_9GAMM|nr:Ser/Thr and Tyr protein phosphatase [Budvicia aquatica]VFS47252.1 Uncharacterised protein [Budvicia aquatica]
MPWPADSGYLTKLKLDPFGSRLKVYLIYSGLVGVFFFGLYPTLNWLTSLRSTTFGLYFPFELDIPLIPAFIWLYLSMYLVFIVPVFLLNQGGLKRLAFELIIVTVAAAVIFLLLPAHLGFIRELPDIPVYRMIFEQIFMLDKPHNLVPSLHVAYSATIVLAVQSQCQTSGELWVMAMAHWLNAFYRIDSSTSPIRCVFRRCFVINDLSIYGQIL